MSVIVVCDGHTDPYTPTLKELQEKSYQYNCVICSCIKDEEIYLDEWVTYHLSLGFDHIWLYDNNSAISVAEYIKSYKWASYVTVIPWPCKEQPQRKANQHFLDSNIDAMWAAFIDIDEFFDIKDDRSINELMEDYNDYSAVHFCWEIYNANGLVYKDERPLRERFTRKVRNKDWFDGKFICRPQAVVWLGVHQLCMKWNHLHVDSHKHLCNYSGMNYQFDICTIAHYFTKSLEEWVNKIKRGSVDKYRLCKYKEFFDYNPDLLPYKDETLWDSNMKAPDGSLKEG